MKRTIQKGFTLVELMIVVALIGIIASIAIPAYEDYRVKAEVNGGYQVTAAWKTSVALCYQENGSLGNFDMCDSGKNGVLSNPIPAPANLYYVKTTNGMIDVAFNALGSTGTNLTLRLTPTRSYGTIKWGMSGTACTDTRKLLKCT